MHNFINSACWNATCMLHTVHLTQDVCNVSLCVCVHDGLCFQYTALRNHRSVPQQTTSYATGQTVCTFISGHLSDGHAMIGELVLAVDVFHWCLWISMVQCCCT